MYMGCLAVEPLQFPSSPPDCQMPNIVLGVWWGNNEKIYRLWIEFMKPSRMSFFLQFMLKGV